MIHYVRKICSFLPVLRRVRSKFSFISKNKFLKPKNNSNPLEFILKIITMSTIVQYIIVRSDLKSALGWPLGAIIAQCCHAATSVMHMHAGDDEATKLYLADMDNMHKVVLEAKDEAALRKLATKLEENNIKHKMWIEQPEDIPTCIAVKPYVKDDVHKFVKHLKLLKE